MSEADKLLNVAQDYHRDASLTSNKDGTGIITSRIDVPCSVLGEHINLQTLIEPNDFAIYLGDLLVVDKVEGQKILADDVSMFLDDLLKAVRDGRATVTERVLLGKKAYTLQVVNSTLRGHRSTGHAPYQTLTETVIEKFGKKLRSSPLTFRKA